MRRLFFAAAVLLFSFNSAALPIAAQSHHSKFQNLVHKQQQHRLKVAPADEYFGRLKMSILGVRNSLKDLSIKVANNPERGGDQLGAAGMVEDAIRDWERKYPQDSWLPKSVYMLSQLYASIHTDEGQRRASATLAWVVEKYPKSEFAPSARAQLGHAALQK